MRAVWLGMAVLLTLGVHAMAQTPAVRMDFTNPQANPWRWTIILRPDGSGHFRSERSTAPLSAGQELEAPDVNRDIEVTPQFAEHVFLTARRENWFNDKCASHLKVAFQGEKKLSYSGPEGEGSCTFNYSRDKAIQELSDSLIAVAQTILEGARLEMYLEHDPLGLNQEMQFLTQAAQDGQAQQICTIRSILQRLAQDNNVMELVRRQAKKLLAR